MEEEKCQCGKDAMFAVNEVEGWTYYCPNCFMDRSYESFSKVLNKLKSNLFSRGNKK